MQIVVNVMAKPRTGSLRELVINDLRNDHHDLELHSEKKKGRTKGWAKVKAKDLPGALNISWHSESRMLVARAIAKRNNDPSELVARFVGYLLRHRRSKFESLVVRAI